METNSEEIPAVEVAKRAAAIALKAHAGQFRRDGLVPYIRHPEAVAHRVAGDALAEAVAWLHDVLEDTTVTEMELRAAGMPEAVMMAVRLLTKPKGADSSNTWRSSKPTLWRARLRSPTCWPI